jgi:hypothetical protein
LLNIKPAEVEALFLMGFSERFGDGFFEHYKLCTAGDDAGYDGDDPDDHQLDALSRGASSGERASRGAPEPMVA